MINSTPNTLKALNIDELSQEQQQQTKGGLVLYCEEKRRNVLGMTFTYMQWRVANDGRLGLTIRR